MHLKLIACCMLFVLHCSYAPPVTPEKKENDSEIKEDMEEYMEYYRYLKEVVQALESDSEFRERLEKADEEDVRSGKIAEQLDFVNHQVRTQLDEIKRRELERLRHLATKQYNLSNHLDSDKSISEHLDDANPHTFEIEDLKKLIKKTSSDLEVADSKRRDEFKEYEMQKEFEKHQKLDHMNATEKKEFEHKIEEEEKAKKHHEPLRHPVTKEQLEDLWKKADELEAKDFNPRAFFMMHDVDGNGVWDANEVKALFISELDKMYGPNGPNKDLNERAEEMERMREHVFKESDFNRDGLIDFQEFIEQTKRAEYNKDQGWQPIDENQIYTQSEYQDFEKRKMEELHYLQQRGLVDTYGRPLPGTHQQIRQALHEKFQQDQMKIHNKNQYYVDGYDPAPQPGQFGEHPGQIPQGQFGQHSPQQYAQNQGQQHPQAQYAQNQGQHPQAQYAQNQGQHPQAQYVQNQGQQHPQAQYDQNQGQHPQAQYVQNQGQHPQAHYDQNQGQQHPQAHYDQNQGQQHAQAQYVQNQVPQVQGQIPPVQVPQSQGQVPPVYGQPNDQKQNNNQIPPQHKPVAPQEQKQGDYAHH